MMASESPGREAGRREDSFLLLYVRNINNFLQLNGVEMEGAVPVKSDHHI